LPSSSDVAFSPRVKAVQTRKGSRAAYARMEAAGGWATDIDGGLREFIARQSSVVIATASADGQPYVQHRGGPPGFVRVLDARTLAFAELEGNRQYITQGNLEENPRAQLLFIDYATRERVKVWGRARLVGNDAALLQAVASPAARPGAQVLVFSVSAWDVNCSKHIPQRLDAKVVEQALEERDARIAALEQQLRTLRASAPS
jgi:predicted pyridoxine 5'-phosphate oxidase superfamily flavin-nucleotide-binding protein